MRLEDLRPNAVVRGILPDCLVSVVGVQWFGSEALELTYEDPAGRVANQLLYRHDESRLEVVEHGRPWSFDGDGALFRLVSEAHRIRLAHLFDPVLAGLDAGAFRARSASRAGEQTQVMPEPVAPPRREENHGVGPSFSKQDFLIELGRDFCFVGSLPDDWDPTTGGRLTVWEMVHHMIRVLEAGGESAAAVLSGKLDARAEVARELAYRLYTVSERKKRAQEALRYNALVQSWPEISRLARERGTRRAEQTNLFQSVED